MTDDTISMKEYVNDKVTFVTTYFEEKIRALKEATTIAASAMEKRLESMNEFRAQAKDKDITFVTLAEYNSTVTKMNAEITELRLAKATLEGKATQTQVIWAYAIGIIGAVSGIVGMILALNK